MVVDRAAWLPAQVAPGPGPGPMPAPVPGAGGGVDPATARQTAVSILARPEFQPEDRSLIERFFAWLGRHLPSFGGRRTGLPAAGGRGGTSVVAWLLLMVLAAVGVWLIVRFARATPVGRTARKKTAPVAGEALEPERGPTEWDEIAAAHEAAGRWRDAVLARYRAAVGRVRSAGLVVAPGRTTGELRADVATGLSAVAGPFGRLTDAVEAGWYAGQPLGPTDGRTARDLSDQVAVGVAHLRSAADAATGDAATGDAAEAPTAPSERAP